MSDLYLERYPFLQRLRHDKPVNVIWHNTMINCERPIGLAENHTDARGNRLDLTADHGFDRPTAKELLDLAPAESGLRAFIPVERIGCYAAAAVRPRPLSAISPRTHYIWPA